MPRAEPPAEQEAGPGGPETPPALETGRSRGSGRLGRGRRRNLAVTQIDAVAGLWDLSGMAVRVSKNVSLTPELEAFVDGQVASGRYQTASEVVRAGLRLLQTQEQAAGAARGAAEAGRRRAAE